MQHTGLICHSDRMNENAPHIPLAHQAFSDSDARQRIEQFVDHLVQRRTVRQFAPTPVQPELIEQALRAACNAPSGANKQPWHFCVVTDPEVKRQIRLAAEQEEREFYAGKAGDQWLDDLKPLATDDQKPFLETAPCLIGVFLERYGVDKQGNKTKNYYMPESVGIACGFLIAALHHAGLATLTHTPSPMKFLNQIMGRPSRERPFLLLVAGHPAPDVQVPDIQRKNPTQTISWK